MLTHKPWILKPFQSKTFIQQNFVTNEIPTTQNVFFKNSFTFRDLFRNAAFHTGMRAGSWGHPSKGGPKVDPARLQTTRTELLGKISGRQRTSGRSGWPVEREVPAACPQLQSGHSFQRRGGYGSWPAHDSGKTRFSFKIKILFLSDH